MTIEIIATINSDGARRGADQLQRALDGSRASVAGFDRGILSLNRALAGLAGYLSVRALVDLGKSAISAADDFARLEGRLNAVGTQGFGAVAIMDALAGAAGRARTAASNLTDIYARNAQALENLGLSASESVRITETLSKLGTIAGQSVEGTSKALFQLSQSLNAGAFRGEEFNSVAEQLPTLMRLLAKETNLSLGELRKFAAEGKLTADLVASAILNASGEVDAQFGKMATTTDQALTVMSDSFAREFGKISKEVGVTDAWVGAINEVTEVLTSPEGQSAMRTFAEGMVGIANAARWAIDGIKSLIASTNAYYDQLEANVRETNGLPPPIPTQNPGALLAGLDAFSASQGAVPTFDTATANRREVRLGAGSSDSEGKKTARNIQRAKELLEAEKLQNAIAQAKIGNETEVVRQLEKQLEIHGRITPEMEKYAPALAKSIEEQINLGDELARQLEQHEALQARNLAFAESFSSTVVDGFRGAIAEGQNFSQTLRTVAADLFEVVAQAALLDPIKQQLTTSVSQGLGGFDIGSVAGSIFGGLGFANGTVLNGPARFSAPGMAGVAGEAGPEAILPLRRGANGALGVVAAGGGGNTTVVNIAIDGDATDATIAKMERVARLVFAGERKGVVNESVSAVRREHLRDKNFLTR